MRRLGLARGLLTALLGTLVVPAAWAQEVLVHAGVDAQKIGVEDQVQLTVTLEGAAVGVGNVPLPALHNLQLVAGPSVSTQVSLVNGRMSQSKGLTYVLQPVAVGDARIGPVRLSLEGRDHTTEAISIEVVPGSVRPRGARPGRRADPFGWDPFADDPFGSVFGRDRRQRPEPKLFLEARPSRGRLHVGEPLVLTYYIFTQASITDFRPTQAPQYPGFWVEDLEREQVPGGQRVTVEGEAYQRFPILQKLLFPTKAGKLTIPPAGFRLGVTRQSFFDSGAVVQRSTKPVTVSVEPIPDQPGFSGAVGQFRAAASVDRDSVTLGDAVTLRFKVSGKGNLKWVDKPPELEAENVKLYPPQVKSDLKVDRRGMSGSKTWEFVVVPETTGELEIPALAFSYFDPEAGRLVRSETAAIPLHVEGAAGAVAGSLPLPARGLAREGRLPLRTELDPPGRLSGSLGKRALGVGLGLALLLHGGLWLGVIVADRRRRHQGRAAPRPSVRRALSDLSRAGKDRMTKEATAALIEKTLHDVFGTLGADGSAPADPREREAREVLREVEFLRYAPQLGDYSEKIREVATRAAEVVRRWA